MAIGTTRMKAGPAATTTPEANGAAPITPPGVAALWCLIAALSSGGLLWSCYQPAALGTYLGWFAMAPLLVLVRTQTRPSLVYLFALLAGLAFYTPALSWMRVAHSMMVAAWLALSVYMALYMPAAIWLIRFFDRRKVPLIVSVPLVCVALEYFRCIFLTGFPWYLLAHTQHDQLAMIQITDLGGVFLVSFVVAAVNGFLFDVAYQFPEVRRWFNQSEMEPYRLYASVDILNRSFLADWLFRRNMLLEGSALVILLVSTYAYGVFQLGQDHFYAGPTVCLLQSNLDQRLREGGAPEGDGKFFVLGGICAPAFIDKGETVEQHFAKLCLRASKNHHPQPDLIIWPETSFPSPWIDVSPKLPVELVPDEWRDGALDIRYRLKDLGKKYTEIPHLLGMNTWCLEADGKPHHYNTALFLSANGDVEAKFDKIHRVPFGEYIPMKDWLPFLSVLSPYEGDFSVKPGEKLTRFKINDYHFGVVICYEDTDPFLARRYLEKSADGPPVDFLVNISNDGWFDGSAEHEEHLAVCRFRTIECRRAMVRAVNMGVSAVIDSNGRVLKPVLYPGTTPPVWVVQAERFKLPELPMSEWHEFKKTAGVLKATVPIDHRFSLYATIGDVLPIGCWLAIVGVTGWTMVRGRFMASRAA